MVEISICIPAYKRPQNIDRLLQSISLQTFQPFEIVVTDDSPDDSVQEVVNRYMNLRIRYYRNKPALGTPTNWNYGISLARGEWIKLMHDDDWFRTAGSLQAFADKTSEGQKFIVSRYVNVFEKGGEEMPAFPERWKQRIIQEPVTLLATNVIGPPSVTLLHRSISEQYDPAMKWRVDLDLYIRLLKAEKNVTLINEPLVNVGISSTQVTNDCINLPEVELPEGWLLLQKYGVQPLKHLLVFDAWWRILRNTNVRSETQLQEFVPGRQWPAVIRSMLAQQRKLPQKLLRSGFVSKPAMFLSYLKNQKYLRS